jgi:threonine/homoserine/homoserine lactone efflux protein
MPTDSLTAIFIFSFLASIGAVVSPGPVMAAIVTESPRQGWRVGPLVALGHTLLELVIVILLGYGLSLGLANPTISLIIALAGGALLLFIGISYLRGVYQGSIRLPEPDVGIKQRSPSSMVLLGMGTTISNPFWYTWWVTVAAGYLAQARELGFLAVVVFFIGHISADFAWDSTLSITTSAGSRLLNNRSYRGLILITGIFMLYLGISFLVSARTFFG